MDELKKNNAIALLKKLAIEESVMSYQEFAKRLGINKAPVIKTVTSFLEQLMIEDIKYNRPILASVVVQKGPSAMPRQGFFQLLNTLNILSDVDDMAAIKAWHACECQKLKEYLSRESNE